jgi:hypothetical protein
MTLLETHCHLRRYQEISECWAQKGIGACKSLGTVWLNQSLTEVDWS